MENTAKVAGGSTAKGLCLSQKLQVGTGHDAHRHLFGWLSFNFLLKFSPEISPPKTAPPWWALGDRAMVTFSPWHTGEK